MRRILEEGEVRGILEVCSGDMCDSYLRVSMHHVCLI